MSFNIEFVGSSADEVKAELEAIAAPEVVKLVVERALEAVPQGKAVFVRIAGHLAVRGDANGASAIEVAVRPVMHNIPKRKTA